MLCELLEEVRGKPAILMGDFNYPDIDWSTSQAYTPSSQSFVDSIEDSFLTQHVRDGTCNGAVLDLVITSEPDMIDKVTVMGNLGNSDHNMLEWEVHLTPVLSSLFNCPGLNYAQADFPAIRQALSQTDWSRVLQGDANDKWRAFHNVLKSLETQFVPKKKASKHKKKAPWMSYKAVRFIARKHKLFKKYKSVKHPAYMKAARAAAVEIRRSKRSFEKKLAMNIDTDRKSFYAYVRSRSRSRHVVGPLVDDQGDVINSSQDLTEKFNTYFSSVFTVENLSNLPTADEIFHGAESEKLYDIVFNEVVVRQKLEKLRADKASGVDELSPRILTELKDEICHPVTVIMKSSFDTGVVPDDWRTANVTPIFKKGNRNKVENFRPVSLTSQIGKLFEMIVRDSLVEHLDKNGLINASQHGFRKGGSCLSNLLTFLDGVTRSLDNHDTVDVIYLDFAKAFDKVPHKRLLDKLDKHGISGKVWVWLKEWLSNRRQRVCVNGCKSAWEAVTSGVPQGSVLGPILFLIYINDIDSNLVSSILKFADDTKLYGKANNDHDRQVIQRDLDSLLEWSDKWQMPFNSSKCIVMHLGKGNREFSYFMGNQQLDTVDEERDLGVVITSNLKSSRQCHTAYAKASRSLGLIYRTISYKNQDVLLKLYKTLVRPHLEYCISAWSPHYVKDKVLLERVQHRLTRMIPGLRKMDYEDRLAHLGLWTLEERRNRSDLLEVFRMFKGLSLTPFNHFFTLNTSANTRGHSAKIAKNRCRLDLRLFFFSERVIDRWNGLYQWIIDSATVNSFKNGLEHMRKTRMGYFKD